MEPVISIQGLGKKYRLGAQSTGYGALRDMLADVMKSGWRRSQPREEFWALRDVSFDIQPGEIVGVIGRNGAGKSTMLKILSQITEPTEGEAHLWGRVASLLEVGVGFHPELTGRENIFLNGAILGMSRAEIRRKFDEIVEFSEVGAFLETPVKRYSSGMYVRLAFSVAAHLEPDVLIVDEVLSVGDAAFQKKCLGKMDDIHNQGRSIIVVSHNMSTVASLCNRVVWLVKGRVAEIGHASVVVGRYLSDGIESRVSWSPKKQAKSDFNFNSVEIIRADTGESTDTFPADAPVEIRFDVTVVQEIAPGRLIMRLTNDEGNVVLTSTSSDRSPYQTHYWDVGRHIYRCTVPANLLTPGQYFVTINQHPITEIRFHHHILSFTVSEQNSLVARDRRPGIVAPILDWGLETLDEVESRE